VRCSISTQVERFQDPNILEVAKRTETRGHEYITRVQCELTEHAARADTRPVARLESMQAYAAQRAARLARALTFDRWMWFLRRLPPLVFDAAPQHLQVFDWYFVEVSAALSAAPGTMTERGGPVRHKIVDTVLSFVAFALWDSNLRARLRCSRLGVPLDDNPIPEIVQTDPMAAALRLVDERRQREAIPFARWGTLAGALSRSQPDFTVMTYVRSTALRTTSTDLLGRSLDPCEITGWFYVHHLDLHAVRTALADATLDQFQGATHSLNIIMLLRILGVLALMGRGPAEELLTTGLCYVDRELFRFACHDALPKTWSWFAEACQKYGAATTADELERQLRSHPVALDPLRSGPLIYDVVGGIALNAAAASQELSAALEFPAIAGQAANVRAHTFEIELQQLIDSSPSAPQQKIRELVRRKLRTGGKVFTDIDAIAERNGCLLLVSCKSVPFRAAYDAGDPRLTRNIASQIVDAVTDWMAKVEYLRSNPRGDNYDLSGLDLVPVVCTPLVMQVPIGIATEVAIGGLRRYCSATELRDWLFAAT
jgi:hypothetical protein